MELEKTELGNIAILQFKVSTILDDTNAQKFKETLISTLNDGKNVLFDFSNLNLISSSGMGSLVAVSALANEKKLGFGFFGVSSNLMNLFKVTKLYMIFKIFETKEDAIATFSGR